MRAQHRPEIEGLRTVAVLLVAVYHIWFGTVSGGVDVFLLLTGFLITGSLVRAMEREGRIGFAAFWARLARRLFPAASVVLAGVLVGAFLLQPRSRWSETLSEVIASGLYYVNWHLSFGAVDYMAENSAASPVQHFWSLAIQGQFYLLWPVLVTAVAFAARRFGFSLVQGMTAATAAVTAVSLGYSVWITSAEPAWAYFDTGARLWELALGGLLAMVLPHVRVPAGARVLMGWLGLTALVLCGLMVADRLAYPGYASLWPTTAAALVILAGTTGSRFGADRLLTWRPLTAFGGTAYPLFLWHWPVLVFYLEVTERVRPSLVGGFYVLGTSLVLAFATTWLVEGGVERLARRRTTPAWSLALAAGFLAPVMAGATLWSGELAAQQRLRAELSTDVNSYPGAAVLVNRELAEGVPSLPVYPDTANAAEVTRDDTQGCNTPIPSSELYPCEFGADEAEYTIALVGSSHSRHWYRALRRIAEDNGWRLVLLTKNACHFSAEPQLRGGSEYTECTEWNDNVMHYLDQRRPDAVFTTATRTVPDSRTGREHVVDGSVERWHQMEKLGIDVIAVRDTPRFSFDVPECVDRRGADDCTEPRSHSLEDTFPVEHLDSVPKNVAFLDLTPYLCPEDQCVTVLGNQLMYYDTDHFSYSFSQSLAGVLAPHLQDALGEVEIADA